MKLKATRDCKIAKATKEGVLSYDLEKGVEFEAPKEHVKVLLDTGYVEKVEETTKKTKEVNE